MAGPAKNPSDSMVLAATLAAVSSPGWVASEGSRAIWAGRNAVATTDVIRPRAYTTMRRAVGGDDDAGDRHQREPDQVGDDHHPAAVVVVGQHRHER